MNAKRKPGRPVKMTPLRVEIIFAAIARGANITQACTIVGVHPSTYCKWAIRAGRRSYPRPKLPTLWAKDLTKRDRLFLWHLAYRLPAAYALTPERLQEACKRCHYSYDRLLDIQYYYPQAWGRMLTKRAYRHRGVPDPQVTEDKLGAARMVDLMCRHPRKARIIGLPFYGVIYSKTLRAHNADAHARACEETQALQAPDSVGPVAEIHDNLGISADVAIDEQVERGEVTQRADEHAMPEWLREFIRRPGWAPSDDQESSW
jgi:hypothetical protein